MQDDFKEASLEQFKNELKAWLNTESLNAQWLAVNLDKSLGTVKNWLYNPTLNITAKNIQKIRALQEAHKKGGRELSYPNQSKPMKIVGFVFEAAPKEASDSISRWADAAGVYLIHGHSGSWRVKDNALLLFASWITDTLMDAVRETIRAEMDNKGSDFDILSYQGDRRGAPTSELFLHGKHGRKDEYGQLEYELREDEETFTIPVLENRWQHHYLELAAQMTESKIGAAPHSAMSTEEYIIESLNDIIYSSAKSDLDAFLFSN